MKVQRVNLNLKEKKGISDTNMKDIKNKKGSTNFNDEKKDMSSTLPRSSPS